MSHFIHAMFSGFLNLISGLFLIGVSGATIVLVLTFWEDMKTLAGK